MTNLPITTSAPQTAAASKQAANNTDTGDAQNTQPFGEVLARQIREPNAKDAKTDSKLAVDVLAQLGTDTKTTGKDKEATDTAKTDVIPADNTATLPADMLAALLPQVMNAAPAATSPATSARSDSPATVVGTTQDKRAIASQKADASGIQTVLTAKTDTSPPSGAPVKDTSFAAAFADSANRTSAIADMNTVAREAIASAATAAAAPQSNAAAIAALQNTAAPLVQAVQVTINTPVTQDKWGDEFNQKITWLASSNKDQTAELHLNPPQLGPMDVVIKVSGDQATALFTSPHAAVRDAIEQAMPRLREMLADNGIMLGNATVSDQAPRDPNQTGPQRASASAGNDIRDTAFTSDSAPRVSQISRHNGIVDTFA
jgi:flagellar hook-length control protein FliK